MNEQIEKLLVQCNYLTDGSCDLSRESRLIELVVRECSRICDDGNGECSSMAENKWKNHCRDLILAKFGLKKE